MEVLNIERKQKEKEFYVKLENYEFGSEGEKVSDIGRKTRSLFGVKNESLKCTEKQMIRERGLNSGPMETLN